MEGSHRVIVDMDGVLVEPHKKIIAAVNDKFGTDYDVEDWIEWDTDWMEEEEHGEYALETMFRHPRLYEDLDPIPGAIEGFERLYDMTGGNAIVVSSPMIGHADSKLRWLSRHGIGRQKRVITANKELVARKGTIFIEDSPIFLNQTEHTTVIMDQPWNRHIDTRLTLMGPTLHRVHSWEQILDAVELFLGNPYM